MFFCANSSLFLTARVKNKKALAIGFTVCGEKEKVMVRIRIKFSSNFFPSMLSFYSNAKEQGFLEALPLPTL